MGDLLKNHFGRRNLTLIRGGGSTNQAGLSIMFLMGRRQTTMAYVALIFGSFLLLFGIMGSLGAWSTIRNRATGWALDAVMGVVGLGGGGGLAVYGLRSLRQEAFGSAIDETAGDPPWLKDRSWVSGRFVHRASSGVATAWLIALAVSIFAALIVPFMILELGEGKRDALLKLIVPAIAIGVIIWAIRRTVRAFRFPRSTLVLDKVPAPIGGHLLGRIEVPVDRAKLVAAGVIEVRLDAWNSKTTYNGRDMSTTSTSIWSGRVDVAPESVLSVPEGCAIPVDVPIPGHVRPTEFRDEDDTVTWTLSASAALPGGDFDAEFEVPVYHDALKYVAPGE